MSRGDDTQTPIGKQQRYAVSRLDRDRTPAAPADDDVGGREFGRAGLLEFFRNDRCPPVHLAEADECRGRLECIGDVRPARVRRAVLAPERPRPGGEEMRRDGFQDRADKRGAERRVAPLEQWVWTRQYHECVSTIIGLGIDATDIPRIASTIERYGNRFIQRIFTEREIAYCMRRREPSIHFAGRFAAKEAAMKALGTGHTQNVLWQSVEVVRHGGPPRLEFHAGAKRRFDAMGAGSSLLTITHSDALAIAQVMLFAR